MNLNVDYFLFRKKFNCKNSTNIKMIEDYLTEYCSESLSKLSLQNSKWESTELRWHIIFQDTQKQFTNVKYLRITRCIFDKELPFKKIFPNVETLKCGHNNYEKYAAIQIHLPTLKNLWFDDFSNYNSGFKENDLKEFFKLNPQLEKVMFCGSEACCLNWCNLDYIKEYCPHVQFFWSLFDNAFSFLYYIRSPKLNYIPNDLGQYDRYPVQISDEEHKLYPAHISNEYKNALKTLFTRYFDIF